MRAVKKQVRLLMAKSGIGNNAFRGKTASPARGGHVAPNGWNMDDIHGLQCLNTTIHQNFILDDKKFNLSIVLYQSGVILRGFYRKKCPDLPLISAKSEKRT
jgi:hypothetical protein